MVVSSLMISCRCGHMNLRARRHVQLACSKRGDGTDDAESRNAKALPGGGYLLPNPFRIVESGYLYGPGKMGFAMFKHSATTDSNKLVPYDAGEPPAVCIGADGKEISIDLTEGTIFDLKVMAETVDESDASIHLKLLGAGNIAGMLPAATGDIENVEEPSPGSGANQNSEENLFVAGNSSPRRTLGISFTCNKCGARNVKFLNPVAWKRGTVFLQCAGCKVHHKVVDHLNLTTEFGSGTEAATDPDAEAMQEIERLDRLARLRSIMPEIMRPLQSQDEAE